MLEQPIRKLDTLGDALVIWQVLQRLLYRATDVEAQAVGGVGRSQRLVDGLEVIRELLEDVGECLCQEGLVEATGLHASGILPCAPRDHLPRALAPATYTPGGNTAQFDAIAQTVGRADAEKRPGERVLCLIITDGEENSSRETTLEQVRTIIREREGRGDWTFAYLGAAPDRWAAETGMSAGSSAALCLAEPRASFRVASDATRRLRASSRASTRTFFDRDERS